MQVEMKKLLLVGLVVIVLLAVGLAWNFWPRDLGDDDLRLFRGIPTAEIPQECRGYRNNVCALYSCIMNLKLADTTLRCQCKSGPDQILYEKSGVSIKNESEAIDFVKEYLRDSVKDYLKNMGSKPEDYSIQIWNQTAVNLGPSEHNKVFFKVWMRYVYQYPPMAPIFDNTFTVAADGTIIDTICLV